MSAISAIIPTYRRIEKLRTALTRILDCDPAPAEVIVHVDAGDTETGPWIERAFPAVRILASASRAGPGGGRNKLVAAASHELVASFDDDSYPLDRDYFFRLARAFEALPGAAAIASAIVHPGEAAPEPLRAAAPTVHFVGCGVAYRRDRFSRTGGYVPLPVAFGMEEVDLAIRLTGSGDSIYFTPWLRVYHDTDRAHHADAAVTAGSIANVALLAYLRYPPPYWPRALLQLANRVAWLVRARRFSGIASGVLAIPGHLWRNRRFRGPVASRDLERYFSLREANPVLEPLP